LFFLSSFFFCFLFFISRLSFLVLTDLIFRPLEL
jgi:hypothetical protein